MNENSNKKVPMYRQIKAYLLELIEQNKDAVNFRIPSENQLAIKFGISRICARKALLSLEEDNIVFRIQGKGTFLNENRDLKFHKSNLARGKSGDGLWKHVAFILPANNSDFFNCIVYNVNRFMLKKNMIMHLLFTYQDQSLEDFLIKHANSANISGFVICPTDFDVYSAEILKLSINNFPTVILDRSLAGLNLSTVTSDHFNSSHHAVKSLIARGHSQIYFARDKDNLASSVSERVNGFLSGFIDSNVFYDKKFVLDLPLQDVNALKSYFEEFLKTNKITAMLCPSGFACSHLQEAVASVTDEKIDYILYDNETPYIETDKHIMLLQNAVEIARTVTDLLHDKIVYGGENKHVVVPFTFANFDRITDLREKKPSAIPKT